MPALAHIIASCAAVSASERCRPTGTRSAIAWANPSA